jgi:hypothetical protein
VHREYRVPSYSVLAAKDHVLSYSALTDNIVNEVELYAGPYIRRQGYI